MRKIIDLPDAYWGYLQKTYGDVENGIQKLLEKVEPKLKSAPIVRNKTNQILYLIWQGVRTSASLAEHMPSVNKATITTLIHSLQQRNYVQIDKNEWPRVYTITQKGLEKLDK